MAEFAALLKKRYPRPNVSWVVFIKALSYRLKWKLMRKAGQEGLLGRKCN
jgi:hypothetical protein